MALRRARERRLPLGRVGERRGVVNVENLVRVAPLLFGSTHQQQSLGIEVVKMAVFEETGGLPVLEFFSLIIRNLQYKYPRTILSNELCYFPNQGCKHKLQRSFQQVSPRLRTHSFGLE